MPNDVRSKAKKRKQRLTNMAMQDAVANRQGAGQVTVPIAGGKTLIKGRNVDVVTKGSETVRVTPTNKRKKASTNDAKQVANRLETEKKMGLRRGRKR